ncbi:hypothetical protein DL93DRAFT_2088214 [Clavulina sp. PMI_390]|nr:hypothetical protein DL93DRAFT_2088214 [Clavulina sp. PMI_390]
MSPSPILRSSDRSGMSSSQRPFSGEFTRRDPQTLTMSPRPTMSHLQTTRKASQALLDTTSDHTPVFSKGSGSTTVEHDAELQRDRDSVSRSRDRESRSTTRDSDGSQSKSRSRVRRSPSRDSVRSTISASSSTRPKSTLASRFPGSSWLFGGMRSMSSQSASNVEAIAERDESPRRSSKLGAVDRDDGDDDAPLTSTSTTSAVRPLPTALSVLSSIHQSQAGLVGGVPSTPLPDPIAIPQKSTSTSIVHRPPTELDPEPPLQAIVHRAPPRISPFHLLNPTRPITISRQHAVLARCWQHVFHRPTFTNEIKWTAMCAPAALPLTTEYAISEETLNTEYVDYTFDVYITEAVQGSFLLRKWPQPPSSSAGKGAQDWEAEKANWARLVMLEMIAARLVQGFQIVVRSEDNKDTFDPATFDPQAENLPKMIPGALPVGVVDVLPTLAHPVYLSIGTQLHRLLYEPVENVIRVSRYVRRTAKQSVKNVDYACLVWPKLGSGYTEAATSFSLPDFDAYGWNRLDRTITGYQRDFGDQVRYWRTRYLVIPSEEPPMERYAEHGFRERLNDEECRLAGILRLALLFHQSRWLAPEENKDTYTPPQFLPTTLDPPACVLDEDLMAALDESNATAATGQRRIADMEFENTSLEGLAQLMRDEPGLIRYNQWHGNQYPDSFTGRQWVTWMVRAFRDVPSRDVAEERGQELLDQKFFQHIRKQHGFMDGHYYYRLGPQYAAPPRPPPTESRERWFTSTSRSSSKERSRGGGSDLSTSNSSSRSEPPSGGGLRPRKKHQLSQTMIIHADYRKRSTQAENLILHHDVIQNPGTAFHFELNWIGTAGRCIDDLLKYWSNIIAPYGLKLVEGYVDPIVDITQANIFQSCFPIPLALAPPRVTDHAIQERLPSGSSFAYYFEYAILRRFGYILDIEAQGSYADTVVDDVHYSYRQATFRQSQFVHQSGRAFVQVMGGKEGFRWVTNRLLAASTATALSFPASGSGGGIGLDSRGKVVGGGSKDASITPHEKAAKLREELTKFCADEDQLARFYEETIANLPDIRYFDDQDDDDDNGGGKKFVRGRSSV